jgi:hypothetical protein
MSSEAKEIKRVLNNIKRGNKIFFSVARYKKAGLIKTKNIYEIHMGKKISVGTKFCLTDKAKRIINLP